MKMKQFTLEQYENKEIPTLYFTRDYPSNGYPVYKKGNEYPVYDHSLGRLNNLITLSNVLTVRNPNIDKLPGKNYKIELKITDLETDNSVSGFLYGDDRGTLSEYGVSPIEEAYSYLLTEMEKIKEHLCRVNLEERVEGILYNLSTVQIITDEDFNLIREALDLIVEKRLKENEK